MVLLVMIPASWVVGRLNVSLSIGTRMAHEELERESRDFKDVS